MVTSGKFVAAGQNKQVQHLEGGILREILVREGDLVEAGQPVMRLDDTAAQARLRRLMLRRLRLLTGRALRSRPSQRLNERLKNLPFPA